MSLHKLERLEEEQHAVVKQHEDGVARDDHGQHADQNLGLAVRGDIRRSLEEAEQDGEHGRHQRQHRPVECGLEAEAVVVHVVQQRPENGDHEEDDETQEDRQQMHVHGGLDQRDLARDAQHHKRGQCGDEDVFARGNDVLVILEAHWVLLFLMRRIALYFY